MSIGNARVMTVRARSEDYRAMKRFDVSAGDEIWALGTAAFPDEEGLGKLPPGLSLQPERADDVHFRAFRVIDDSAHR
jgi:hypothetical protein